MQYRHLIFSFSLVIMAGCGTGSPKQENQDRSNDDETTAVSTPVFDTVIESNWHISLPADYIVKEEQTGRGKVYYFQHKEGEGTHGEAGMYIGLKPNEAPPTSDHTRREFPGTFNGQSTTWIEYSTSAYTQRETFYTINDTSRIHVWCYSSDPKELDMLFTSMSTMQQK